MQTFTHKGVQITLDHNGEFYATVRGKAVHKPSLAAMKKFIDTPPKFAPFKAIRHQYGTIQEIEVVGIHRERSKWSHNQFVFKVQVNGHDSTERSVIEDTPANRELLVRINEKAEENRKINERLSKELDDMRRQIVHIEAGKFGVGS